MKQRERGGGKKQSTTGSCFIVSRSMAKTVGLLSAVALKDPSITNRAQCSPCRLAKRGHFPLCWPTLLNPASVNKISSGSHYDQHTNKAITSHEKESDKIKNMAEGVVPAHEPSVAKQSFTLNNTQSVYYLKMLSSYKMHSALMGEHGVMRALNRNPFLKTTVVVFQLGLKPQRGLLCRKPND